MKRIIWTYTCGICQSSLPDATHCVVKKPIVIINPNFRQLRAIFPIFFKLSKTTKQKRKNLNGHSKAFLNQNYVILPMKIATLSTYKYFQDGHTVTLTNLGIVIVTYTYDLATVSTMAGSQALRLLHPLKWVFSGRLSPLVVVGSLTLKIRQLSLV